MIHRSIAIVAFGLSLVSIVQADSWDRNAVYAEREAGLKRRIEARPNDPNALVDLAAFYLKPLAPRTVEAADGKARTLNVPLRNEVVGSIKFVVAVPWVFRGDTSAAWPLLKRAIELDPKNVRAARELAMYYRMRGDLDRMKPHMDVALRADPNDLDMCRLFLDHRTALARVLNDQAADLRTPKAHEEDRPDGRYRVTSYPSEADLARAKELDAQAQGVRREAIIPLQTLAKNLRDDKTRESNPAKQAKWRLATAVYLQWIGELEKAAGTAAAGLREDPTNLDCLDYVIDLVRGTRTKDKHAEYKSILDRWSGADTTPTVLEDKPRGPRS
ncbi:MAG: tetratricopeptide repeat protein [Opitutaceae bacterium]